MQGSYAKAKLILCKYNANETHSINKFDSILGLHYLCFTILIK